MSGQLACERPDLLAGVQVSGRTISAMDKVACSTAMVMRMRAHGSRTIALVWPSTSMQPEISLWADISTTGEKA